MIMNKQTKKSHINDDYTHAHILYNSKFRKRGYCHLDDTVLRNLSRKTELYVHFFTEPLGWPCEGINYLTQLVPPLLPCITSFFLLFTPPL
jgi:hypothetical protein